MTIRSARSSIGLPVILGDDSLIGTVESFVIVADKKTVDGLLIGRVDSDTQQFLPLECIIDFTDAYLRAHDRLITVPKGSQRILGLPAWTIAPKFLAGFVYDCFFDPETSDIQSFAVHQLVRTWRVPATAVSEITPKHLLIDTDTTVKLKLTPYPTSL